MTGNPQKSRRSKLDKLAPEAQEAAFAYCENVTITEGIRWLAAEHDVEVGTNTLSRWLKRQRAIYCVRLNQRKTRPDCVLGMLKGDQQERIEKHCEEVTLEEGVRWLAEEMKLAVSPNALGIWLRRRRNEKEYSGTLEAIQDNSDRATLVGNVVGAAAALTEANVVMLAQAVFEEFNKKPEKRDEKRLTQYMKLALHGRSVSLAFDRFHFDAAKRASECAEELHAIHEGEADESEKIEKVIELLFGPRPTNTTFQPEADEAAAEA